MNVKLITKDIPHDSPMFAGHLLRKGHPLVGHVYAYVDPDDTDAPIWSIQRECC